MSEEAKLTEEEKAVEEYIKSLVFEDLDMVDIEDIYSYIKGHINQFYKWLKSRKEAIGYTSVKWLKCNTCSRDVQR